MAILPWRPGLLSAPVGNNRANNPEDILNMKSAFARIGRYKKPVENGYIDEELNGAIKGIQRDHNLKRDNYMNPGGETEAALVMENLIGKKPKADAGIKVAFAPAVAAAPMAVGELMTLLGLTATAGGAAIAVDKWQKMPKEERERLLVDPFGIKLENKKHNGDRPQIDKGYIDGTYEVVGTEYPKPDKEECHKEFDEDWDECDSIPYKEPDRRKHCWGKMNERYGDCDNGKKSKPLSEWMRLYDISTGRIAP